MNIRTILAVIAALAATGCTVVPYESEPMCDVPGYGRCASVTEAYEEALQPKPAIPAPGQSPSPAEAGASEGPPRPASSSPSPDGYAPSASLQRETDPRAAYRTGLYRELTGLVDAPTTPMVRPARVARLLVLPYADEPSGQLYMPRHVYFFVDRPQWLLAPAPEAAP